MDSNLAKLIVDNGIDLFPYLKLRSDYVIHGTLSNEKAIRMVGNQSLDILFDSGYIGRGPNADIVLEDDAGWLCDPPPQKGAQQNRLRQANRANSNFDLQLDKIARIVGIPIDFGSRRGKYRKLYRRLLTLPYTYDYIETVAYNNENIGLNLFFTEKTFRSLAQTFESECR